MRDVLGVITNDAAELAEIDEEIETITSLYGDGPYAAMPLATQKRFDALCERQEELVFALPD